MKDKSIDINQRIPLATLNTALGIHLAGKYTSEYIMEQLRLEFNGENRIKKSIRIVEKIILRNPMNGFLLANKSEIIQALKKKTDRNIILIALLNGSFVFSYDLLRFFGKFFSVQELVNRETIKKPLVKIYGGNRSTDNAIDSVLPMFIEADLIIRNKLGVYELNKDLQITAPVAKKLFIESFKENNSIADLQEYQLRDPYFIFINH